jgi:hypothetical protein
MTKIKNKTSKEEDYLQESFEKIEVLLETLDLKPYSKTLIELRLRAVARKYGKPAANKLIEDLGLEYHGWKKEK